MEKNVGGADRMFRWVMGGSCIIGGLCARGWVRAGLLGAGALFLGTAATRKCACNAAMGINTYENEEKEMGTPSASQSADRGTAAAVQAT